MEFSYLRRKCGTQEELAIMLNISQNTISNWENGKAYPRRATLRKLAEILGVDEGEVLKSIDESSKLL